MADGDVAVITGSAGFLGRAFAARLTADGWAVRGVDVRPGPSTTVADVTRPGDWREVLDGARLVVHTAAIVAEHGEEATFWHVNVAGTREVLRAAGAAGVERVLHLSSVVVHGPDFPDGVDESGAVRMTGNPYTDTKVAAEHAALLAHAEGVVPVTVLRPGDVYGPHSQPWTVRPVELMRRGLFVLVDGGAGILSPTYVDDVVDAGAAVALDPRAEGRVLHVTGGEAVTARRFFGYYAQMLGHRMRSVPARAAASLARPVDGLSRALGWSPPMSPRAIEYLVRSGTYAIEAIADAVGWRPRVPLAEGMLHTQTWLEDVGLVPRTGRLPGPPAG